jgi:hypothetical protein
VTKRLIPLSANENSPEEMRYKNICLRPQDFYHRWDMEGGANETCAGLFRATVYKCWEVSHSSYLWRIRWRGAILGENNIVFGEDLAFPLLQRLERCWDSSQYSDYAKGWMIHSLNRNRGKRCFLPKCPDQLWDPPS